MKNLRIAIGVGVCLLVVGCQEPKVVDSPSGIPPSLKLVPVNYYHYRYSRKLHKRVREIIPSNELIPVPEVDKKEQERTFAKAAEDLYRAQKNLEIAPK